MYKLYKITDPNGLVYYGITGQNFAVRFQNGKHYEHNPYFAEANMKYVGEMVKEIIAEYETEDEALIEESLHIVLDKTFKREIGYNIYTGKTMMKRRFPRGYLHKETNQFFFTLDDAAEEFDVTPQCISKAVRDGRSCRCGTFETTFFDCVRQKPVSKEMFERLTVYWEIIKEESAK